MSFFALYLFSSVAPPPALHQRGIPTVLSVQGYMRAYQKQSGQSFCDVLKQIDVCCYSIGRELFACLLFWRRLWYGVVFAGLFEAKGMDWDFVAKLLHESLRETDGDLASAAYQLLSTAFNRGA